jgi:flavin reductase (DIM6/NTAB) family NADH-FMN oxidoreductase RutF
LHHGTHYIFVGEIESLRLNQPGAPLVYRARMYEQLGESGSLSLEDMEYSWERYT